MERLVINATNAEDHRGGFVGTGGFYIRPISWPKGIVHDGHSHYIDHVGNLVSGQVRVHWRDPDGGEGVIEMLVPSKIHMPAQRFHRIEVLEDCVWECWFAQAEADRAYGAETNVRWHMEAL